MRHNRKRSPAPSRIVIRGTNWVGDTIISLPALREARRIFPSAEIAVWAPSGLRDLIDLAGIGDEILTFHQDHGGPAIRPFKMRSRLAGCGFDLAVLFQNAFESAFTAWLARIPLRAGYPTDLRGPLLNIKAELTDEIRRKHQVFHYLGITDFVEEYFHGSRRNNNPQPDCSVLIPVETLSRARGLLISLGASMERPIFSLCPGSVNSEAKRWPADCFARLADLLAGHDHGQIAFLGASHEHALIESIRAQMRTRDSMNLAGLADMTLAMAVMYLSRMVISNDTGSAHLAVAASAKVLTIFGPTSPGATAPFGPDAHIIQGKAQCAPCRHFRCPDPGHPCMRSIAPEGVFAKIREILGPSAMKPGGVS